MAGNYIIRGEAIKLGQKLVYKSGIDAVQAQGDPAGRDQELYKSKLGTPVFQDITVDPFSYTVDGVTYFVPGVKLETFLITVSSQKNIILTPIQGLNNTVKEYISSNDDQILIAGTITGQNGIYPINAVNDLKQLLAAPVSFKVTNRYLQNLGIETIAITGYNLPQEEGGYSYQYFEITAISDVPVELKIVSSSNTTAQ